MTDALLSPVLEGTLVRLEPLAPRHIHDLVEASRGDRDTFGYTEVPHDFEGVERWLQARLDAATSGDALTFAQVRLRDGCAVGSTAFRTLRFAPPSAFPYAVEIGATWLAATAQRSGINVEAKLLMFEHAFAAWGAARVDLRTDARNARSRRAIEALGARFEGVLRNCQPSFVAGEEGRVRDSAMYSVTDDEWPAVATFLRRRLARH